MERLGLGTPRRMAALAVKRGCRHYGTYADSSVPMDTLASAALTDEELAIALLCPANPYDPVLIRIGAQVLSAPHCKPEKLVHLAIQEKCTSVLRHIAECGNATEPDEPFWHVLLENLPVGAPIPDGVMPHPSRFRIESGISNPRRTLEPRVRWLRPIPA